MSCRKVSRELLERFRFGEELDVRSDPHLAHLQSCVACRDEVGMDRALVIQLRRALRERVAGSAPPEGSWESVRARALALRTAGSGPSPLVHRMRMVPAALAVGVMVLAVSATQDAQLPAAIQVRSGELHQTVSNVAPKWKLPWYLRYRTVQPVAPSRGGLTATDFPDPIDPVPPRASGLMQ